MPNKKNGLSSAEYYKLNPQSYAKKLAAQKKINATPKERAKRSELVKLNREAQKNGTGKVGDKKDIAHKANGKTRMEAQSKNRGSNSDRPGDRRARPKKK